MIVKNENDLSDQLNKLNIYLHEMVDLTDIIILGLESESMDNIELAISGISILRRLLKEAGVMSEGAINLLDNSV